MLISSMTISFIFTKMNHPLAMGIIILLQTLMITMITGSMAPNFWFSYILFLIFLGGLLVLFIYVTSLASNEMFSLSTPLMISAMGIFMLTFLIMYLTDTFPTLSLNMNWEMKPPTLSNCTEAPIDLFKLYTNPTALITLMLVFYLFLTLIAVVKITKIARGPLRPFN
uniref:NADH-ubiquinone oxidoreductase chain 6 n=1 Tax=Etrocorema hochii TaxID=2684660 RepID=A0A6B9PEQ1_9NEOP|nr:NADH dehydrogenase subunit 6 [Etrocorema hochii]